MTNKIRLTIHVNSLLSLANNRRIYFKHPQLDSDIEIVLGEDIAQLELWTIDDMKYLANAQHTKPENMN